MVDWFLLLSSRHRDTEINYSFLFSLFMKFFLNFFLFVYKTFLSSVYKYMNIIIKIIDILMNYVADVLIIILKEKAVSITAVNTNRTIFQN